MKFGIMYFRFVIITILLKYQFEKYRSPWHYRELKVFETYVKRRFDQSPQNVGVFYFVSNRASRRFFYENLSILFCEQYERSIAITWGTSFEKSS